jgi:hypothetical protein
MIQLEDFTNDVCYDLYSNHNMFNNNSNMLNNNNSNMLRKELRLNNNCKYLMI